MKILVAGPGTGKTTKIQKIISEHGNGSKFLILSFTNATVSDLQSSLQELNVTSSNCMTLHKFAVKYNHDKSRHVLMNKEIYEIEVIAERVGVPFEAFCDFLDCTTFDQMISRFVEFAKGNPRYLSEKLADYDSLIVDEYQDFNETEQSLIDILINTIKDSYVMGDDDQCIYDFKDASTDKIIALHEDSSHSVIEHEHICYRCPDCVVNHATNLISNNKKRIPKKWEKSGKDGDINYTQLNTFDDVAEAICSKIEKLDPKETVLVLTPVSFAAKPLLNRLSEKKIAFMDFFTPQVIEETLLMAWEVRSLFGKYKYLNLILLGYLKLDARKKFYELVKVHFDNGQNYEDLFALLKSKIPEEMQFPSTLENLLQHECYSEILSLYSKAEGKTDDEKLENMLRASDPMLEANIKIMTIHKSKGLGADHVFMIGLNEGILPNQKKGNDSIESQRRLFYVGMTRAKKSLSLFSNINIEGKYANKVNKDDFKYNHRTKVWQGRASSFISELKF